MNRIYAETLLSNQPSWLNFSNSTYSTTSLEVSTTFPLPVSLYFRNMEKSFSIILMIKLIVFGFTLAGSRWDQGFDANTRRTN